MLQAASQVDNRIKVKQYKKVGYKDAKTWMERRLANMKSGVPNWAATDLASQWCEGLKRHNLVETIAEIESINLANQYNQWHVLRLGSMSQQQLEGVFRILGGQLSSASSSEVHSRKTGDIICLIKEWEIQGGAISEVGVNRGTYPSLANLVSWFGKIFRTCACTRHIISTRGWPIISQEAQQPLHAWSCSGITSKKEMTSAVLVIGV